MGFLILIAFAMYGLGTMCHFPEAKRPKNAIDNNHENPEPDRRAGRPAVARPPDRPGTNSKGKYCRAAAEDPDGSDGEVSIDELEYMRHFFR